MRRSVTGVSIYIISLDTFMLLAVLGITLGILFLVVNPMLNFRNPGIKELKTTFDIDKNEFDTFINQISSLRIIEDSESGYPDLDIARREFPQDMTIVRWYKPKNGLIGQIRKTENTYNFLRIIFNDNGNEYSVSMVGIEGISGIYISADSIQKKIINEELKYWPDLRDISNR